jgi:hypothetical protein
MKPVLILLLLMAVSQFAMGEGAVRSFNCRITQMAEACFGT